MVDTIDILVAYDVQTTTSKGKRRLRRVAQLCKDYGQRVQFSVFACRVTQAQMEALEAQSPLIAHGLDRYRDFDEPLVL